jgi:sulfate adenylyltransferase
MSEGIPKPHGGRLVNRVIENAEIKDMQAISINKDLANDVENIADGIFSPLEGFMNEEDFMNVLKEGRLANGVAWTIPIVLDLNEEDAKMAKDAKDIILKYDKPIAIMHVEDTYRFDKREMAKAVYQTDDINHPGVAKTMNMNNILVSGKIDLIDRPYDQLKMHRLTPRETRDEFNRRGWNTVVGFQTRNIPHLAHEMLQKTALNLFDGLFINPLIGKKKSGDFKDEVIIKAYETLLKYYYPKDSAMFVTLHTEMRYAGPKEAIMHAIMRKNFGCSHFIVGRDHAGVGNYYHPFAAHEIFKDYPDLEIKPLFFSAFFYCKVCMGTVSAKVCPHGKEDRIELSGTKLRKMVTEGERPSELLMRPEVTDLILNYKDPFVP